MSNGYDLRRKTFVDLSNGDMKLGLPQTIEDILRATPPFSCLPAARLERVITLFTPRTYREDEIVLHDHDSGADFFIVAAGTLRVLLDAREFRRLEWGNCFGESALLNARPPVATITVASAEAELWCLDAVMYAAVTDPALGEGAVFRGLPTRLAERHLQSLPLRKYRRGEAVFRQGDSGKGAECFVVAGGCLRMVSCGREVTEFRSGDFFGQHALLHERPRASTVEVASAYAVLCVIDWEAFLALVRSRLESSLFHGVASSTISALMDSLRLQSHPQGEAVVRQGDLAGGAYIVADGTLRVVVDGVEVGDHLSFGDHFGERSTLLGLEHHATVEVASSDAVLWRVGRDTLSSAVSPSLLRRLRGRDPNSYNGKVLAGLEYPRVCH